MNIRVELGELLMNDVEFSVKYTTNYKKQH